MFTLKIQFKWEQFPREEMIAGKGSCPQSSCKKEWEIREQEQELVVGRSTGSSSVVTGGR